MFEAERNGPTAVEIVVEIATATGIGHAGPTSPGRPGRPTPAAPAGGKELTDGRAPDPGPDQGIGPRERALEGARRRLKRGSSGALAAGAMVAP